MPTTRKDPTLLERARSRERSLSRWENEGGSLVAGPQHGCAPGGVADSVPALSNAELVQLQVRVIALENLVLALLSQASLPQLDRIREMARYISPRPGFTPHRLTIHAAALMVHLAERAGDLADSHRDAPGKPALSR